MLSSWKNPPSGPEFQCYLDRADGSYNYIFYNGGIRVRAGNAADYPAVERLFQAFEIKVDKALR